MRVLQSLTHVFVLSLSLNILRQQYRTSQDAQRALDAAYASTDLATNPRVLVKIFHEPRTVTDVAIPGTMLARYNIPYGVPVTWETLIFKMSSMGPVFTFICSFHLVLAS